ncbi:alpha/beta hydrolase [Companilactobacillus kimchiensis]|uniref:Xaa-Pro dipeptidyl-peptidase-like domain-containing protein n=1 Tax=Companilactobacillus kimchiensis TaxID=993692 RepID=A0A0R2LJT5_9LACO|nr:alpha/beta hydrolase [Companilactobacillus kimchiensis]KRN98861.1 hypothetical protein IV57_GL000774 [Companilactobacillus kimchiensis]
MDEVEKIVAIKAPLEEYNSTPVVFDNEDSGLKLSGIVYTPVNMKADAKLPGLVVQGPMGATKEQTQSLYAQLMAIKGYVTMVYDYSYLGASQGQPRGTEDPNVKASDIKSAITFLSTYKNVDAKHLGAIGICGSGVYLPLEALHETRLNAIVSVNPFTVIDTVKTAPEEEIQAQKDLYEKTGKATRLDLIEPGSEGAEYYFDYKRGAAVNRVEFVSWSQLDWQKFHPTEIVKDLKQPYLMICGENAFTRPGAEVMFKNAGSENKKLVIIPKARHFDLYDGEDYVPTAIENITEFLKENI